MTTDDDARPTPVIDLIDQYARTYAGASRRNRRHRRTLITARLAALDVEQVAPAGTQAQ